MELNTIMQALVKDLAEQMRPAIAQMVREELANAQGETGLAGIAANIDLAELARHVAPSDLVANVDWSEVLDYDEIASNVDLSDLASELDADGIADKIDIEDALRDFFQNNSFSIRP